MLTVPDRLGALSKASKPATRLPTVCYLVTKIRNMNVEHIIRAGDGNTGNTRLSVRVSSTYAAHAGDIPVLNNPPPLIQKKRTITNKTTAHREPSWRECKNRTLDSRPRQLAKKTGMNGQKGAFMASRHSRRDDTPSAITTPGDLTQSRFNP